MCVITGTFPLLVTGTYLHVNQAHKYIVAHIVIPHVGDVLLLLHAIEEYNKVHVCYIIGRTNAHMSTYRLYHMLSPCACCNRSK